MFTMSGAARVLVILSALSWVASGCGDSGKGEDSGSESNAAVESNDTTQSNDTVTGQELRPSYTIGQTWVVGSIYRSTSVKTPEELIGITGEAAERLSNSSIEIDPLMPAAVVPEDGTDWSTPIFWRMGVINTNYVPEGGVFAELATDASGQVQPITIIKAVAPKELNSRTVADGLDPVFYLVLRESDLRVKAIHYNYKVKNGRNTVVLEMPEVESGMMVPGADQDYFLVDYMMPVFPVTVASGTVAYGPQGANLEMEVVKTADDAAEVTFESAVDHRPIHQHWTAGSPWFDYSITEARRSWVVDEETVLDLLEGNGVDVWTNSQFLEEAEAISVKFQNRYNVKRNLRVEAGTDVSRTPDSQTPWAGYWYPLKQAGTAFGWSGGGRRLVETGPGTSIKAEIREDLTAIDNLLDEILDMDRDAPERKEKVTEYWDKKNEVAEKIRTHFEDPENGVIAQLKDGRMNLDDAANFGPLEKFGLYLLATKVDRPFEALIWEMTKQYNPAGGGWWGKCNGWSAAAILTHEPREPVTLQLDLANIVADGEGTLNVNMDTGDLKALAASAYYGTRSHFYGQRYYGDDDDRGGSYQDIHPDVFHRLISFYIGTEKFPIVFDLTAGDQVWNYPCYAYEADIGEVETLDEGTKGLNKATTEELVAAGASEAAAQAIVDRIRSSKGAFAEWSKVSGLEAVKSEDVTKLQEAGYTLWGERRAHRVATALRCATDGVDAWHLDTPGQDPRGFTKDYTYNLVVNDSGDVVRGEWTNGSTEDHPDFAWVPYANEDRPSDSTTWRRHGSWERYVESVYWGRYAPSENPFLYTDILDTMLDVRVNAPVVCNPDPDDCGEGFQCNAVDGTCTEVAIPEPDPNDTCLGATVRDGATALDAAEITGAVCSGRESWFGVELTEGQKIEAVVTFDHGLGDIDISFHDAEGKKLRSSTSTSDMESITWTAATSGLHFLKVYGYSGAANDVTVNLSVTDAGEVAQCAEEAAEPNNNQASAGSLEPGAELSGALCGSDADWFKVELSGGWTVSLAFSHAAGDLDLRAYDAEGNQLDISQSTEDVEKVTGTGTGFVEVYGYRGATGAYTLSVEE